MLWYNITMSVENRILSEEQRIIVDGAIKSLCRPLGCLALSKHGCSTGKLMGDKLPLCYAGKKGKEKMALLIEGVEAKSESIGPEMTIAILGFLKQASIVTRQELEKIQSRQLTLKEKFREETQNT